MTPESKTRDSGDSPERRLRHRGSEKLTEEQLSRRQKVFDRIEVVGPDRWAWVGQAKSARGKRYPQFLLTLGGGTTQLVNARHVLFYLATGWVHEGVQQYRSRDRDPMNVHPDNIVPVPPLETARRNNNFWDSERLKSYFG